MDKIKNLTKKKNSQPKVLSDQKIKVEQEYRKADLNIKGVLDITKISRINDSLVPCVVTDVTDTQSYKYSYNTKNLISFKTIENEVELTKLKVLMNISKLKDVFIEFKTSLNPNNLYYDINGITKILFRDVYPQGMSYDEEIFIEEYKSLIGCTYDNKYSYEDYKEGGLALLNDDDFLKSINECKTIGEIEETIFNRYYEKVQQDKEEYVKVKKVNNLVIKIVAIVCAVLLLFSLFFLFNTKKENTHLNTLLNATNNFSKKEYMKTISSLKDIASDDLDNNSKYILAYSYIETSGMDNDAKENALSQISKDNKDKYNTFWVYLGRKEFKQAYNIANEFSSDRLLYYAYSVEYESLSTNTSMSASAKEKRKKELKELLDDYVEKINGSKEGS